MGMSGGHVGWTRMSRIKEVRGRNRGQENNGLTNPRAAENAREIRIIEN
jgi:hypothetical protein